MIRTDARLAVFILIFALLLPEASSAQKKTPPPARPATAKPAGAAAPAKTAKPAKPAPLTREQMRDFLLTAEVVSFKEIGKGVTKPKRFTLTKNGFTHDAAFQSVDERKQTKNVGGRTELNFVDAYRYNLAAYAIAGLLGLDHMMPVHVERKWKSETGSLSWWQESLMDEGERQKKKIQPPNPRDWNEQMFRMRAFAALIRDTDRNQGNILISPEWKVVMIDFTRAFRTQTELVNARDLGRMDKALLAKFGTLTEERIKAAVGKYLDDDEIEAVLERRDRLIKHFDELVAKRGAAAVLY